MAPFKCEGIIGRKNGTVNATRDVKGTSQRHRINGGINMELDGQMPCPARRCGDIGIAEPSGISVDTAGDRHACRDHPPAQHSNNLSARRAHSLSATKEGRPPCFCHLARGESVRSLRYHAIRRTRSSAASFRHRGKTAAFVRFACPEPQYSIPDEVRVLIWHDIGFRLQPSTSCSAAARYWCKKTWETTRKSPSGRKILEDSGSLFVWF